MSKKIIIFGEINKKLLLPIFLALGQTIINIINEYYPEETHNFVLNLYPISLGQILIKILPYLLRISNIYNKNKDENIHKNKKYSHYFLLYFFKILNFSSILLALFVKKRFSGDSLEVTSPKTIETFFEQGIQMILLALISFFLLKYRYYVHNFIAMVLFLIAGLGSDIIVGYFQLKIKTYFLAIIIDYIYIFTDCIIICYEKYMMEKLYYSYWNIYFALGLLLLGVAIIATIIILILGKDSDIVFVKGFFNYFKKTSVGIIIGKELITLILYFIQCSLFITTLFYFNPEYILISLQFSKLTKLLIDKSREKSHSKDYFYFLILFVFQIFCLLIYLEIIELNFLSLNMNTRRNIKERGLTEHFLGDNKDADNDTDIQGIIDINPEYYYHDNANEGESDQSTVGLNENESENC